MRLIYCILVLFAFNNIVLSQQGYDYNPPLKPFGASTGRPGESINPASRAGPTTQFPSTFGTYPSAKPQSPRYQSSQAPQSPHGFQSPRYEGSLTSQSPNYQGSQEVQGLRYQQPGSSQTHGYQGSQGPRGSEYQGSQGSQNGQEVQRPGPQSSQGIHEPGQQGSRGFPSPGSQGYQDSQSPSYSNQQGGQGSSGQFQGFNDQKDTRGQPEQRLTNDQGAPGFSTISEENGENKQYAETVDEGDYSAIPGQPDIDYPILSYIPETSFKCDQQQYPGYYADTETRCQVFHICANGRMYDFLCPNGTIFHQEYLVCVWWNQFDCNSAPSLYGINANIYDYSIRGNEPSSSGTVFQGEQGFPPSVQGQGQGPDYQGRLEPFNEYNQQASQGSTAGQTESTTPNYSNFNREKSNINYLDRSQSSTSSYSSTGPQHSSQQYPQTTSGGYNGFQKPSKEYSELEKAAPGRPNLDNGFSGPQQPTREYLPPINS